MVISACSPFLILARSALPTVVATVKVPVEITVIVGGARRARPEPDAGAVRGAGAAGAGAWSRPPSRPCRPWRCHRGDRAADRGPQGRRGEGVLAWATMLFCTATLAFAAFSSSSVVLELSSAVARSSLAAW